MSRRTGGALPLKIKRVYEPRSPDDGQRVLVDRLWPRGLAREELGDALWLKDIAPSASLRKWFGHRPERWEEFRRRYEAELDQNTSAVSKLRAVLKRGPVTLLYSARDAAHNQALVLAEYLQKHA